MMKKGLSDKQIFSIQDCDARMNFWIGSIRAGKTFASILAFIYALKNGPPGDAMIVGVSRTTIQRNILKEMFDLMDFPEPNENRMYTMVYGRRVYFVGAKDERAVSVIQGATLALAYVDELPKIPKQFFKMLQGRCSVPGAKIFATGNPEGPSHWLKKEYIDAPNLDMKHYKFILDDNPSLDEKYLENIKKEYTGVWYQRLILGEWSVADGLVYDHFNEDNLYEGEHFPPAYYIAGIDYGTSNATCCLLAGVYPKGFTKVRIVKEYYYDSRVRGRSKTDSELATDMYGMLKNFSNLRSVYVDPSALSLKLELDRKGLPVENAENDVIDGIKIVSSMLYNKQVVINKDCVNLIDSLHSYTWDSKAADRGEDKPKKEDDHGCFVEGTQILSEFGQMPIDEVEVNHYVWTRKGLKRVEQIFSHEREVNEFTFYGKEIKCTPDHKFFTLRGWIEIGDLLRSDILFTTEDIWEHKENLSRLNSMGKHTDGIQILLNSMNEIISQPMENIYIERFGNSILERYPEDIIFITSTKTPLTMIYPICNAFHPNNTFDCMKDVIVQLLSAKNVEKLQINGTDQQKEGNGIKNMQRNNDWENGNLKNVNAAFATKLSRALKDQAKDFVQITVDLNGEEKLALTMSPKTANSVANFSSQINILRSNAVQNLAEFKTLGKKKVYNFSVEDLHEYFAEEFLVKNCDALKYLLASEFPDAEVGDDRHGWTVDKWRREMREYTTSEILDMNLR
jgi:PBSX family phage terminase large subunit